MARPIIRRPRPSVVSRLGRPLVVLAPSVELALRTLRLLLRARAGRVDRQRRLPHYRLRPPTAVNPTPLPRPDQRTIIDAMLRAAQRLRVDAVRRRPSSVLYPPGTVVGSQLPVTRSPGSRGLSGPIVHPAPVLITSPPWRFVVTDIGSAVLTFLDQRLKATGAAPEPPVATAPAGEPGPAAGGR